MSVAEGTARSIRRTEIMSIFIGVAMAALLCILGIVVLPMYRDIQQLNNEINTIDGQVEALQVEMQKIKQKIK